ncbi:MAG TPA: hypothetical protein VJN18_01795 [Polyangiaceae bacterium]|nr:hypothetical protein [Polyangiaceae bacterium]
MKAGAICLAGLLFCLSACAGSATTSASAPGFEVTFRATGDDGMPLAGVKLDGAKKPLGATDRSGVLAARLHGVEGQVIAVKATCPESHASPEVLPPLRLSRTRALGSARPEPIAYDVVCQKRIRQVVVVVKAERGKNLPVLFNGRPVATTDADGHAHALIEMDRTATSLRVDIDTTTDRSLLPQNPGRTFELHGNDAVLVLAQPFSVTTRPKNRSVTQAPRRHVPQRLD